MDELEQGARAAGLEITVREYVPVATVRRFGSGAAVEAAVRDLTGQGLPAPGRLLAAGPYWLAWRSPTETLCVAQEAEAISRLVVAVGEREDGVALDLTGALSAIEVSGARLDELACRLGGAQGSPGPGEARRTRLADIAVFAFCPRPQSLQLLTERPLASHLLGWIRETLLDLS
ncbi:MAG: hypothetical protein JOZ67_10005 [Gammaproteobacteria bacterium]|nr:hypothetical protein [Gammaproteobacteria bacterium]MBV9695926.1 hypothetical protein [Gammaproteobacteria bacterium]